MNRTWVRRLTGCSTALTVAAFLAATVVVLLPGTPVASAAPPAAGDGWSSGTRTLTRTYFPGGSTTPYTETSKVSVSVDKHTDLQSRERIQVSWKGAVPTGGLQGNPYGSGGLNQEYPVAILECRGTAATARPDTCWTTTSFERTYSTDKSAAAWLDDRYNTAADAAAVSGTSSSALPKDCAKIDPDWAYHFTGFKRANGKVDSACDSDHMPPEAAVGSVDPPNEVFGQTGTDGTGSASFEVRTKTENESLGCSHTVACSLVVVPIVGLSCAHPGGTCNAGPYYFPGDRYDGTNSPQLAVSGYLWWSPSNWRNRIVVPLSFALPPNTCQLLTTSTPVPFYGSELLSQAALQWAPAYCLNKKRFNWQSNSMPDDAALTLAGNGGAIAAEVAGASSSTAGFAFAPTALTGFGIAYGVDDPGSGQPLRTLKLDARLLAKLLTESYPADAIGVNHPGLRDNPRTLEADPEFLKLNPGFHPIRGGTQPSSAATLLALSTSSAVVSQLTAYLADDPDAKAFIDGKPDPWGMKVNPAYRRIDLPVSTWPLLDTWKPGKVGVDCLDANPSVYLQNIAAPVSSLRLIATAMLFNWPNVQTTCEKDLGTGLWKIGRGGVQSYGQRFMLGLVTLGDAARYGLPVASLQASPGHYVGPTDAGLRAAVGIATQQKRLRPFDLDQADVRRSASAYPGTMVVYTAARTSGLAKADAAKVAQFIQVSTTQGQEPGRGNGKLPAGYVPITRKGPTGKLYDAAMAARAAILAQHPAGSGGAPPTAPTSPAISAGAHPAVPSPPAASVSVPKAPASAAVPSASAPSPSVDAPGTTTESPTVTTAAVSSSAGGALLPLLLVVGLLAGLGTAVGRVWLRLKGLR